MCVKAILESYETLGFVNKIDEHHFPSRESINQILIFLKELLFPGFFNEKISTVKDIPDITEQRVSFIIDRLVEEVYKCLAWEKKETPYDKDSINEQCYKIVYALIQEVPLLRSKLKKDAISISSGDPAANNITEVVLAYPGFQAILVYRIAHFLYNHKIPLIPRLMSEIVHGDTGIDIHPGAKIGESFCIDHGTGVVIGETTVIGDNVKLYQGVTLGAFSVPKNNSNIKRHPTIKDGVTIYAGSTILGGETIIGANSVIGGNVWLTDSIEKNTKVYLSDHYRRVEKKVIKVNND
ncbi:serine acetyltransferase [Candidatus Marinamargulisbacteria bacterium SCGC AG-410-N11]|nr:serine acetyltransferase [Candidatus Marinamargulisbacteria bacterium SCGC AG-410-N11]